MNILQLIHSKDLKTGGVAKDAFDLKKAILSLGENSQIIDIPSEIMANTLISHGLWQWPGVIAYQNWEKKKFPMLFFRMACWILGLKELIC